MADPAVIQSFINYLKFEKRYSRHTIRSYHDDLLQFFTFQEKQFGTVALNETNSAFIRSWLASLKDDTQSARTINRKISSLRSFFKFHIRSGNLDKTPMTNISTPKIAKRLPRYVDEKNTEALFHDIDFGEDWKGKTDRLVMHIFYQTGIRLSELINLKETHINRAGCSLKVLGKGNKERVIPISRELSEDLAGYIAAKRKEFEQFDAEPVLVNEKGKKLYEKYVYLLVKKQLSKVTTIDKKSPHILRHTFATHLTNHGADLNSIKELLGHASLAATQIYTHNSIEKLKEAHKKAHPKG
ncbi:MAG TPA: tyrosine-type recombinase/integrase [Flavitalea sp.]|nr:tyrosine-type recombinase/integrase [Flavitalea sp.]